MKRVYCIKTKQEITNVVIAPNDSYIYIIEGEQNTPKQCNSKFENGEPIASLIGCYVYLSKHKDDINIKIYGDNYVVDNVVRNMSNDALFAFYLNQKRDATFWEKNMIYIAFMITTLLLVALIVANYNRYVKTLERDKVVQEVQLEIARIKARYEK